MRRTAAIGVVLVALWSLTALLPTLQARPATQSQFYYVYRIEARTPLFRASCTVCHESRHGRKLNRYGEDLRRAGHYAKPEYKGYRDIEKLDSDKDGFTNGEEIAAQKLPGSRVSRPKRHKEASAPAEEKPAEADQKGKGEAEDGGADQTNETQPRSQ